MAEARIIRTLAAFLLLASAFAVIGCKGEEDVPYGGEVKTNPQGAEQMKNSGGVTKPMGNTPSIE